MRVVNRFDVRSPDAAHLPKTLIVAMIPTNRGRHTLARTQTSVPFRH
jgi:hypothetical protein